MTTVADVIAHTRRHLYSETRDELNRLTTTIDADDTALDLDFELGGIQTGSLVAIDLEEMHVWSSSVSGGAVVQRAVNGTTAAEHAAGSIIRVNPKVTDFEIVQALNEDLTDLSAQGLFQVTAETIDYDAGTDAYDLPGDIITIIGVTYDANDGTERWNTIDRSAWRIRRSMPTDVFASGQSLTINGYAETGARINVAYKAPFAANLAAVDDDLADTGLPVTAFDLPPIGAAIRLRAGSEVARNFLSQGETRRADEVPAGARSGSLSGLRVLRQQRIAAEAARLYAQYPTVR